MIKYPVCFILEYNSLQLQTSWSRFGELMMANLRRQYQATSLGYLM